MCFFVFYMNIYILIKKNFEQDQSIVLVLVLPIRGKKRRNFFIKNKLI